jgi:regulator of replication initiation timing
MEAEKIIQALNVTVIDITKVVKELIDLNETLEQENQQLVQTIIHYETQLYKLKKIMDVTDIEFNKEN